MTFEGHSDAVTCIAVSGDGRRVASGSRDKTVKIWDAESSKCTTTLKGHTGWVMGVALSMDGRRVASASRDKTVKIWDVESGQCTTTLKGHNIWVTCVVFSGDGRRVASGSHAKVVKIWDTESSECLVTLKGQRGHRDFITCVAFSADSRRVASGSHDNTVKIWDAKSGVCVMSCDTGNRINKLAFDPTSTRLYTDRGVISIEDASAAAISQETTTLSAFHNPRHLGYSARSDGLWITWNGQNVLSLPRTLWLRSFEIFQETFFVGGCLSGRVWSMKFSSTEFPIPFSSRC